VKVLQRAHTTVYLPYIKRLGAAANPRVEQTRGGWNKGGKGKKRAQGEGAERMRRKKQN